MKQVIKKFIEDEWSDDVPFEEIHNFNRIQNKIAELERNKIESLKPLHIKRHKQK